MRERLASLGFAMALEPVPNHTQLTSDDIHEIESIAEACTEDQRHLRIPPSSHTVGRTANTSGHTVNTQERPLKRQRVDSPLSTELRFLVGATYLYPSLLLLSLSGLLQWQTVDALLR